MQILCINVSRLLGHALHVLFQNFGGERDNVLSLVVLDEIERLQRSDDVVRLYRRHLAEITNGQRPTLLTKDLEELVGPIGAKGEIAEV